MSNLNKTFYPDAGYQKGDIIDYYTRIADVMLPHVKGRPLVMKRCPDGIMKSGFYQKEVPEYFPSWIERVRIKLEKGGTQHLVIIRRSADIVYLVNQGTLVFHIWLSTKRNLKKPDKIIFDLDPPKHGNFTDVKFAAYKLRDIFYEKGLKPFVMTTGSKGLHVIIPIRPTHVFDTVRHFAQRTAETLADAYPDTLTTEHRISKRKGRVFLDYLRNAYGQTGVAPYSIRAISHAPIAVPVDWSELPSLNDPQKYNVSNMFRRLAMKDDPWQDMHQHAQKLTL